VINRRIGSDDNDLESKSKVCKAFVRW